MSVSGRPVFVLRGAQPSHRDMAPGSRGPDVRQLEVALRRMGFSPGKIDGRYDGSTASAVASWYQRTGWAPFGATDTAARPAARRARSRSRGAGRVPAGRLVARARRRATSRRRGSIYRPRARP